MRGIRGIFSVSVTSEVEFSQLLIKLIVPLLLCSLINLVPMSVEVKERNEELIHKVVVQAGLGPLRHPSCILEEQACGQNVLSTW